MSISAPRCINSEYSSQFNTFGKFYYLNTLASWTRSWSVVVRIGDVGAVGGQIGLVHIPIVILEIQTQFQFIRLIQNNGSPEQDQVELISKPLQLTDNSCDHQGRSQLPCKCCQLFPLLQSTEHYADQLIKSINRACWQKMKRHDDLSHHPFVEINWFSINAAPVLRR